MKNKFSPDLKIWGFFLPGIFSNKKKKIYKIKKNRLKIINNILNEILNVKN